MALLSTANLLAGAALLLCLGAATAQNDNGMSVRCPWHPFRFSAPSCLHERPHAGRRRGVMGWQRQPWGHGRQGTARGRQLQHGLARTEPTFFAHSAPSRRSVAEALTPPLRLMCPRAAPARAPPRRAAHIHLRAGDPSGRPQRRRRQQRRRRRRTGVSRAARDAFNAPWRVCVCACAPRQQSHSTLARCW